MTPDCCGGGALRIPGNHLARHQLLGFSTFLIGITNLDFRFMKLFPRATSLTVADFLLFPAAE
jgi:hypothetical protein